MRNTGSNMSLLDRLEGYTEGDFKDCGEEGVLLDGSRGTLSLENTVQKTAFRR